jgi:hypothetical protein
MKNKWINHNYFGEMDLNNFLHKKRAPLSDALERLYVSVKKMVAAEGVEPTTSRV